MTRVTPSVIHLAYPRRAQDTRNDSIHEYWWTTSSDSTTGFGSSSVNTSSQATISNPTGASSFASNPSFTSEVPTTRLVTSTSTGGIDTSPIPVTITSLPISITGPYTTSISPSQATYTTTQMATALHASRTALLDLQVQPVCIGDGVDAQSLGLISTVVVSGAIGSLLWVSLLLLVDVCRLTYFSFYLLSYDLAIVKFMRQESGLSSRSTFHATKHASFLANLEDLACGPSPLVVHFGRSYFHMFLSCRQSLRMYLMRDARVDVTLSCSLQMSCWPREPFGYAYGWSLLGHFCL